MKAYLDNNFIQEDKYTKLYEIYLTCLEEDGIIDLLKKDIDKEIKSKILVAFRDLSKCLVDGYNNKDLGLMDEGIKKLFLLNEYIKQSGIKN